MEPVRRRWVEALGALVSPALGAFLDRNGARAVLLLAVLLTGAAALFLSFTHSLVFFFAFYCIACESVSPCTRMENTPPRR